MPKSRLYNVVCTLKVSHCSPTINLYGIALFMFPASPLISSTDHTLNRRSSMDLCNKWGCFHPSFHASCIFICFSKASTDQAIKKYLYKRNPGPAWPEFQVPTVFHPGKQFNECLPIYKHSRLLFTLTLGHKQVDFWLLTGFWFSGYYPGDSLVMQEAGMPCNIKIT